MRAKKAGRSWFKTASLSSSACKHPVKLRSWASIEGTMCVCKEGNERSSQAGVTKRTGGGASRRRQQRAGSVRYAASSAKVPISACMAL